MNSTKVYPCNCVGLVVTRGGPRVDTGGGDCLVLIIVVPTSVHQKVKLAKKEVKTGVFNYCLTLCFTSCLPKGGTTEVNLRCL